MLNSLAYLGFSDIRKIEDMTFAEYNLRIEAYQLKQIKEQEKLALLAWFNQSVQATTGNAKPPKPKYRKFTDFFDSLEMIDELRDEFELDYQPRTQKVKDKKRRDLINARLAEFEMMRRGSHGAEL
ncbi:hypothetical protein [uncultured Ligilactobacillus sp.]|uniref:hypothetical protein n=1 Tax=uncultured Ligilactobacillus sp. TaxID=2837633 RepID=UPI00272AC632|nr:hypothetical protein [uncultured Ligilactobacillus sp.]